MEVPNLKISYGQNKLTILVRIPANVITHFGGS